ncbi:uncharacterized protein O3C94_002981 [Discoglossus pictus]
MWLLLLVLTALVLLYRWYRQSQILHNLSDKYVLITGCDSGFGNLVAKQLDRRGLRVLATCLTNKGAEDLKKETSSRLQTVILDVTDSQSVISATKWVATVVGDKGLWGLVNNAGISIPSAPNEWLKKDDFFKILNVNLLGVVDVTINLLPLIRKARGRVVNVASVAGRISFCGGGYCISKYGVEAFSDSLRREMIQFGVKVCIVEPGFFKTQVTDAKLQKESTNKLWAGLPDGIRRSYGQQYFEKYCSFVDFMLQICKTKLSLVTDCMEHALTAVYPYTRYSAGWDAKLLFLPLSYLPTAFVDFLMGIDQPKPTDRAMVGGGTCPRVHAKRLPAASFGAIVEQHGSCVVSGIRSCAPVSFMCLCLLLLLLALIFLYRWYRQSQILQNISDKYVFITGCDSGFGNLLAKQLDQHGMRVLASCMTEKGAEELKKETSSRLQTVILDVTDNQSVRSAAEWVTNTVGDKGLWGLVNNAGISIPSAANEWLSKDDYFRMLNVNLLGVIDVTINLLALIRKARGRVVNVASIAGRIAICGGGYCISKYGVEAFSDSLRREMKQFGVKVCIIEPGFFKTNITDAKLLKESTCKIWARLPEGIRKSYGQEYFDKVISGTEKNLSTCNTKLSLVTGCMEHALTAVYPHTRYSAGWDAKLFFLPLSYFPTVITDFLLTIGRPKVADSV